MASALVPNVSDTCVVFSTNAVGETHEIAAIITHVYEPGKPDSRVALHVFYILGDGVQTMVEHGQGIDGHWGWPAHLLD